MKTYMPLNGLRWSRNSGSANCDMPQSAVFGRPGGNLLSNTSYLLTCDLYSGTISFIFFTIAMSSWVYEILSYVGFQII